MTRQFVRRGSRQRRGDQVARVGGIDDVIDLEQWWNLYSCRIRLQRSL